MKHTLLPLVIAGAALFLIGCGQPRTAVHAHHQASSSELRWDSELVQLPWREPALGDTHRRRGGAPAYLPGHGEPRALGMQETHPDQRWRAGRHRMPPPNWQVKH